jgi:hypothetical protein
MKRFWVHGVTGLTAIGVIAVLASACAHNDSSLFLRGVLAPPQSATTTGCTFTTDPTQAEEFSGYLDIAVRSDYQAVFLAGNQLIPQANSLQLQTETSRIVIQGAVVSVVDQASQKQIDYYTAVGSGFVDPSNGTTPGFAPVAFTIVSPNGVAALRKELTTPFQSTNIVSNVKAFGTTLGGDYIESNTFEFQITACNGCLVEFTTVNPPVCNTMVATTTTGAPFCFLGEDVPFDCHLCLGDPICDCGQDTCP